jgi:transposase
MVTSTERHSVVTSLWKRGYKKVAELQKLTGYPRRTLFRWTSLLAETGDIKKKKRSGRPRLLDSGQRKYLGKIASSKKCATSKELTEILKKIYPTLVFRHGQSEITSKNSDLKYVFPVLFPF